MKITVAQTASMLNVTTRRVRQLIHAGKIEAEMRGGRWFVESASLDSLTRRNGRPRQTRTCPACGGVARTTANRAMRHGRYIWRCTECGTEFINRNGRTEWTK